MDVLFVLGLRFPLSQIPYETSTDFRTAQQSPAKAALKTKGCRRTQRSGFLWNVGGRRGERN